MLKKIRIVFALCGWIAFAIEWVRISRHTAHSDEVILVILLILALLVIHAVLYAWVGHNKRLASRGTRGTMTRYASPEFVLDHLGRTLIINKEVRQSQEITVSVDGDSKTYYAVGSDVGISIEREHQAYGVAEVSR